MLPFVIGAGAALGVQWLIRRYAAKRGIGAIIGWGSAALAGLVGASRLADSAIPTLEDEITVRVDGNRLSKKRDLYFLALSCAFGRVRNLSFISQLPPAGMLAVDYDATGKSVQVVIKNQYSGISNILADSTDETSIITNGPEEELIGGSWAYYDWTLGGTLPDPPEELEKYVDARILTDKEKIDGVRVINPELPYDDGTRGTFLEWLTAQALSGPCGKPPHPNQTVSNMLSSQANSPNKPKLTPKPKRIPKKGEEEKNKDVNQ